MAPDVLADPDPDTSAADMVDESFPATSEEVQKDTFRAPLASAITKWVHYMTLYQIFCKPDELWAVMQSSRPVVDAQALYDTGASEMRSRCLTALKAIADGASIAPEPKEEANPAFGHVGGMAV